MVQIYGILYLIPHDLPLATRQYKAHIADLPLATRLYKAQIADLPLATRQYKAQIADLPWLRVCTKHR